MTGYAKLTVYLLDSYGKPLGVWRDLPEGQFSHQSDGTVIHQPYSYEDYADEEREKAINSAVESVFVGPRVMSIK